MRFPFRFICTRAVKGVKRGEIFCYSALSQYTQLSENSTSGDWSLTGSRRRSSSFVIIRSGRTFTNKKNSLHSKSLFTPDQHNNAISQSLSAQRNPFKLSRALFVRIHSRFLFQQLNQFFPITKIGCASRANKSEWRHLRAASYISPNRRTICTYLAHLSLGLMCVLSTNAIRKVFASIGKPLVYGPFQSIRVAKSINAAPEW